MYKKILIIFLIFILLGCKRIDSNTNYIDYVVSCLNESSVTNDVSLGYKYYVPRGVKKIKESDYNQVFQAYDTSIYLYVDVISYYYQKDLNISSNDDYFYFEKILNNNKTGYIRIVRENDKYLVDILYNYSKIEFCTDEDNLRKLIVISTIILNSVDYNNTVIEKVLEGDLGEFSDFTYEVDKPEGAVSNFSQILEEYVQKDEESKEEKLPDE